MKVSHLDFVMISSLRLRMLDRGRGGGGSRGRGGRGHGSGGAETSTGSEFLSLLRISEFFRFI